MVWVKYVTRVAVLTISLTGASGTVDQALSYHVMGIGYVS